MEFSQYLGIAAMMTAGGLVYLFASLPEAIESWQKGRTATQRLKTEEARERRHEAEARAREAEAKARLAHPQPDSSP